MLAGSIVDGPAQEVVKDKGSLIFMGWIAPQVAQWIKDFRPNKMRDESAQRQYLIDEGALVALLDFVENDGKRMKRTILTPGEELSGRAGDRRGVQTTAEVRTEREVGPHTTSNGFGESLAE